MAREHEALLAAVASAHPDRAIVVIGAAALRWHFPGFRGTFPWLSVAGTGWLGDGSLA